MRRRSISAWAALAAVLLAVVAQLRLSRPGGEPWGWRFYLLAAVLAAISLRDVRSDEVARPVAAPSRWPGYPTIAAGVGLLLLGVGVEVWVLARLWRQAYDLPATFGWVASLLLVLAGGWLLGRLGPWPDTDAPDDPVLPLSLPPRVEVVLFVLVFLFAIFLRVYRLDQIPPGIFVDETNAALDAVHIMEGSRYSPFSVGWFETPSLYAYYLVALFRVLGVTFMALKAASLIPAILTVAAIYPLARLMFGPVVALASMMLLAFARWHLTMSRWGWNELGPPLFQLIALYFLIRASRERRGRDFVLAGLALGLGMYTYLASRLVVLVVVTYLGYRILFERGFLRRTWRGLILFALAYAITFAPLAETYVRNPFTFLNRTRQVSIARDIERAGGDPMLLVQPWRWRQAPEQARIAREVLGRSVTAHLKMFHLQGDYNPRHNLPGKPMLDPVTGILFVLGLGYAVSRVTDHRWVLLILWIPITLLGGILSTAGEAPQAYRTLGVVPAVALLAGDALVRIAWVWARGLPGRVRVLPAGVAVIGVLLAARLNVVMYFGPQASDRQVWWAFSPVETAVAREVAAGPPVQRLYLTPHFYYFSPLRYLTYRSPREGGGGLSQPPYQQILPVDDLPLSDQGGADALLLLDAYYVNLLDLFTRFYPGAKAVVRRSPWGEPLYLSVRIPGDEIAALQGLDGRFALADGREITARTGMDIVWGPDGPADGQVPTRAEWVGSLAIRRTGQYDLLGEGGLRVEVDGREWDGPRVLGKGLHRLRIVQEDPGATGVARLLWVPPDGSLEPVPRQLLFATEPWEQGLLGTYFQGERWEGPPIFRQITPVVLFSWPEPEPWPGPFSARFEGTLNVPMDGNYFFVVSADDGVRFWIDGQLVGEGVTPAGVNVIEKYVTLTAGPHAVRIDYYQRGGGKALEWWWAPPGQPRQVVPPAVLSPAVARDTW